LEEKNRMIEGKNREIVALRRDLEQLRTDMMASTEMQVGAQQRNRVVAELDSVISTLRGELERIKAAQSPSDGERPSPKKPRDYGYHAIPSEPKLITVLQEKLTDMHGLVALTSDILLEASKQKYMQRSGQE
jgi:hypothetical protein